MAKEITLTSPDGTKFNVLVKHIRLVEQRDQTDLQSIHKSIGLGASRVFLPGGLVYVAQETPSEIKALIDS
jgi:hypothetical protein